MTFCVTDCMAAPATAKPPPAASRQRQQYARQAQFPNNADRRTLQLFIFDPEQLQLDHINDGRNVQVCRTEQDAARDAENHRCQQTQNHQPEHPPGPFLYATRIIGYLKLVSRFAVERQAEEKKRHYAKGMEGGKP